jgi:hypothetical protein
MHHHVHEETNILFPMALAAEAKLTARHGRKGELHVNASRV